MPGYLSFAHWPAPVVTPPTPMQLFHTAAKDGDIATVREMILNNVVAVDVGHNGTALILAAEKGHIQIVQFLLEHGANINHTSLNNSTALNRAVLKNQQAVVDLLVSQGADLTIGNYNGDPVLSIAAGAGNTQMVQQLLASGAPIDFVNTTIAGSRSTALTEAIVRGSLETVEALVDHGADVNLDHGRGLQRAITAGRQDIVAYLQAHGAVLPPAQGGRRARRTRRRLLRRRTQRGRRV